LRREAYGRHALRRTEAVILDKRSGNLRAAQFSSATRRLRLPCAASRRGLRHQPCALPLSEAASGSKSEMKAAAVFGSEGAQEYFAPDLPATWIAPAQIILYSRYMDNNEVIDALSALAQATRLDTFRLLVSREPEGVAAGELARLIEVPQNTLSTHLAILTRAGLVRGERRSRSIIYRADLARLREVTLFLLKDCCGGRPEVCAPLIADLAPCCPPKEAAHG
jgi:ArsR family transcriptional regulator, arsenate/arsenite/antimonite-responsive transcriptional repressor